MKLSAVMACDKNGGVGVNGKIPWHLRSDFQRFKALTIYGAVIMGRKTAQSIGVPLFNRLNIVVSRSGRRDNDLQHSQFYFTDSIASAIQLAQIKKYNDIAFIGGAELVTAALPLINIFYLTVVSCEVKCDTFISDVVQELYTWPGRSEEFVHATKNDDFDMTFFTFRR